MLTKAEIITIVAVILIVAINVPKFLMEQPEDDCTKWERSASFGTVDTVWSVPMSIDTVGYYTANESTLFIVSEDDTTITRLIKEHEVKYDKKLIDVFNMNQFKIAKFE